MDEPHRCPPGGQGGTIDDPINASALQLSCLQKIEQDTAKYVLLLNLESLSLICLEWLSTCR